ncbi:hydrogenase large subunit [Pollutimonas bauzanensis]|uniref:Ni,Fe-hydrogenase III large subunit n=1 Tax=Pollutimonas bauzanensis TaxID=658167 RepID=A0A1M5Y2K8_9BURK|nr:nickel-dependent hydrogenase large subunit [Pollutimonas bauzanensis]SHI06159.1 Ni,Fe-hydrogenase III large subunit [Pollutimonas bauzanensis]SHI39731.1 Ni,Fe-hydrogenase III large subunit [Pollutimonas bauzanensis]
MNDPRIEDLDIDQLPMRCQQLVTQGGRLDFAYAWFPNQDTDPELRYIVHPAPSQPLHIWRCRPGQASIPSLADIAPLASWYEREMSDLCGLHFRGQAHTQPLVFLPGATVTAPPLSLASAEPLLRYKPVAYELPHIGGPDREDIQVLPFGPVRADVVESAQFVFFYIGEAILHYHAQLFFKHRGMEKRFEGRPSDLGVVLAERVSGVGSAAHALAYSQAIEAAAGCVVPPRAQALRVILAELERLYNHLHYLGHLCHTTTLKVGEAQGKYLEELAKQINARVAGDRLLRNLLCPGGLRRNLQLEGLTFDLQKLQDRFAPYARMLETSTPHLDRLITTGLLTRQAAIDQGATGPIERASGINRDLRRDHPYAGYASLLVGATVKEAGDAHARQQVRITEIENSFGLIEQVMNTLPSGPTHVPCTPLPGSEGLGWAESPRGSLYYAVHIGGDGRLARVKIKSPSFSNWRVFPFTVHDSNMMDYAINEASFGLTTAGCDR